VNYIGQIFDLNKKNDSVIRQVSPSFSSSCTSDGSHKKDGRGCGGGRGGRGRAGRGGHGGKSIQSAGRWISYDDWQAMPEHEKDKIRTERRNYAKRKISQVNVVEDGQEDHNTRIPGGNGTGVNANIRQRDKPIDAGDRMSRRN
jgi:hypothetical protein